MPDRRHRLAGSKLATAVREAGGGVEHADSGLITIHGPRGIITIREPAAGTRQDSTLAKIAEATGLEVNP